MWKLDYNFISKILLLIPALFCYGLLFSASYISYIQMEYDFSWYEKVYLFTRHVILFSGAAPLIIYLAWIFLAKGKKINTGILIIIFSIALHYVVAVFSAHGSFGYFILQTIELIFLVLILKFLF